MKHPDEAPIPGGSEIRRMKAADTTTVARVLAGAFYDDPLMKWVVPNDVRRMKGLERVFLASIRDIWLPLDECYVTSDLIGAAMWMPPDSWKVGWRAQLRVAAMSITALWGDSSRMTRLDRFLEEKHPVHPSHWYLNAMGVVPARQGNGFGTKLMSPVLERCDRKGVAAYLETSTPRGRILYVRNGFEVIEGASMGGGAPLIWRMWREPQK